MPFGLNSHDRMENVFCCLVTGKIWLLQFLLSVGAELKRVNPLKCYLNLGPIPNHQNHPHRCSRPDWMRIPSNPSHSVFL